MNMTTNKNTDTYSLSKKKKKTSNQRPEVNIKKIGECGTLIDPLILKFKPLVNI